LVEFNNKTEVTTFKNVLHAWTTLEEDGIAF
jgi:hypothetical protein